MSPQQRDEWTTPDLNVLNVGMDTANMLGSGADLSSEELMPPP